MTDERCGAFGAEEVHPDPIEALRDRIDVAVVPFTERGSRILVFREPAESRLFIRVCERWPKLAHVEGHYRVRPPFVAGFELLDGEGNALAWKLVTYPHVLRFLTGIGPFAMAFDGPELLVIQPPPGRCGVRFAVRAESAATDRRGGWTRGVRHLAYTTNGHVVRNEVHREEAGRWRVTLLIEATPDTQITLNITPRLGFDRRIRPYDPVWEAERRWRRWLEQVPWVAPRFRPTYDYAWYLMRAGLLSSRYYFTREALVPSKVHYVGLWQWDAFFHALAYRYVDPVLAGDQFRVLFDHQRPDGRLPDCVFDEGVVESLEEPVAGLVTKPPIAGWAAWKVYEVTGDCDFVAELYEPVSRLHRWWMQTCDSDGDGLPEYHHPYSSGLDDSPLWDFGMPVASPDLATYLCLEAESLARMARLLGEEVEADRWEAEATGLVERMQERLFDAARGLFWAIRIGGNERVPVLTPLSLLPMWTGRLPAEVVERLVAYLRDPRTFWTRYPVPTVARSDPRYQPDRMWRGPTWVNVNYMLIEALIRCGYRHLARELCDRTLELVARHPDIKEYYHPETGEAPPQAAPGYGWSAALYIDLAIRRSRGEI